MKLAHTSITHIKPYVAGNVTPDGFIFKYNLASNENPFGCSPAASNVLKSYTASHSYPDGNAIALRKCIAHTSNIPFQTILCGAGSEEILHLLARTYASAGDEILIPHYGFSVYTISALSVGATPVFIPRDGDAKTLSVDTILSYVTPKTRMIYLDHPGNPIGNFINRSDLTRLIQSIPPHIIIILDAAYAEYMTEDKEYTAGHEFVEHHPNVVVTRSFSKAYGLAGLRLGWLHASTCIIDMINRVRAPFNTSSLAQHAGIAALTDHAFVERTITHTHSWRKKLEDTLTKANFAFIPCCTNFTLIHLPEHNSKHSATQLYHDLGRKGIIVRPMIMYQLPEYLRISIGTTEAMEALCAHIT